MTTREDRRNEPLSDRVGDLMRLAAEDIDSAALAIPGNFAKANFELAAWNANDAVRRHLERASLILRSGADTARAREELHAALAYVSTVEDAVRRCQERGTGPKSFVHVMNLMWSMLLVMLLRDWGRLAELGRLSQLPVVQEEGLEGESGGVDDTIMKMLIGLIEQDAAIFSRARARFFAARSIDRYYEEYFQYDKLMACLLAQDEQCLDRSLEELDTLFRRRATDKKLVQVPLLGAAGADNDLVVDIWALALAQLAKRYGMQPRFSSDVIPVEAVS